MKYEIVWEQSPVTLENAVRIKIANGWVPQGGVSFATPNVKNKEGEKLVYLIQAMVKHPEV